MKEDSTMPTTPRREDVERRAYELYEQRGHEEGRDWDDWLQAEREMLGADTPSEPIASERASNRRRQKSRP